MKITFLSVITLCAVNACAQLSGNFYVTRPESVTDSLSISEHISSASLRSFKKMFGDVEKTRWHSTEDGYTAKFNQHNIYYHVFYNQRGKWKATIENLPVDMLPKWVVSRVKSEFRSFSIFFAQHIRTPVGHTYILKIEKGNDWKTIRLSREATEVSGEYIRN